VTIKLCRPPLGRDGDLLEELAAIAVHDLDVGITAPEAAGDVQLGAIGSDADAVAAPLLLGILVFPEDFFGLHVQA
jgi:hypothetical protein